MLDSIHDLAAAYKFQKVLESCNHTYRWIPSKGGKWHLTEIQNPQKYTILPGKVFCENQFDVRWRTSGLNWWYMTRVQHVYRLPFRRGWLEGKEEGIPLLSDVLMFFFSMFNYSKIHIILYIYSNYHIISIHTTRFFYDCCTKLTSHPNNDCWDGSVSNWRLLNLGLYVGNLQGLGWKILFSFLNSTLETCLRTSFRVCYQTQVRCTFGCAQRFTASKQTSSPWGDMSGGPRCWNFQDVGNETDSYTWCTMRYALQIDLHGPIYVYIHVFFTRSRRDDFVN